MKHRLWSFGFALLLILPGCSTVGDFFEGDEERMPGERISVLDLQDNLEKDDIVVDAQGFVTPQVWHNEFWPQNGGYPNHTMQHLAMAEGPLEKQWDARVGKGSRKTIPLTAQPVVVDGRVFTLDTESKLRATDIRNGETLWSLDVHDQTEEDDVISGGLSYSQGLLYVTNGYDELLAVNPGKGEILWRVPLPAPSRAAPTILDDRVFVTTLDNRVLALDSQNGEILWDFAGISETAGLVGAASPAANREIVVPAFSSGELFALRVENGAVAWAENLSSLRRASGLSSIADIRGLPVIDKGMVIAISFGGRMAAIDSRTGDRVWTREIGGAETPWVAGNHIFVITSENELVGLARDSGSIIWVTQLPRTKDPEDTVRDIFWTGPVLAGGRLIVASSNGEAKEVAPETGEIIRTWETGKSVKITPVVADKTLYLLGENGVLSAYR